MRLKRINDKFYNYYDAERHMLFTLKYGDRGVYGMGKAWYLYVTFGSDKQTIATFVVIDDGHKCYKGDCEGRLWTNAEAIEAANHMVRIF